MTQQALFHVFKNENDWLIHFNEKFYGPYLSEDEAITNAVDAAHEVGEAGLPTQVVVKAGDGWRPEWTYGADPYPRA